MVHFYPRLYMSRPNIPARHRRLSILLRKDNPERCRTGTSLASHYRSCQNILFECSHLRTSAQGSASLVVLQRSLVEVSE